MGKNFDSTIHLLKYSHDREDNYKKTNDDLFTLIDQFGDKEHLYDLYEYYHRKYGLPETVVKQHLKNTIASLYKYKKGRFSSDLKLKYMVVSVLKFFAVLIYLLINSQNKKKSYKYKLIIDEIAATLELRRFSKLIDIFKKENVLIVITNESVIPECNGYNVRYQSGLKIYDRLEVVKVIRNQLVTGIWVLLKISIKLRINLFRVAVGIDKDYLYYRSLFKSYHSDFIIQERHYTTKAIKNYLFKQMGGSISATIQKNIIQCEAKSFFTDIDYLLSLGHRGVERMVEYGGRIDCVIPVGSMFMEYYWFRNVSNKEKKYDLVNLGINMSSAYERFDSYSKFMDDYYDHIRWIVRFKKEFPLYRITIIHHANSLKDKIEDGIISGSGVTVSDKTENSYKIAFNSKCAVTYGSTMGYELIAHGLPVLFLDPESRCTILPDKDNDLLGNLRIGSYDAFRDSVFNILEKQETKNYLPYNPDDFCLESSTVSNRIYDALVGNLTNST